MLNSDFVSIYDAYYQDVYLYLIKLTKGRKDLAEELTQETFYQVFISLHRFKGKSKLRTWIIEIAKHTCFNYYKKNPLHTSSDAKEWVLEDIERNEMSVEESLILLE
ncbi:MAG: RNA polymerase sigma factor [Clostridium sp.]|nr:RNA polymerase sigma factor [Clostridium sp.]